MPQYLYRIRPSREGFFAHSTPEENAAVSQHFLYLKRLTEQGVVLMAGRTLTSDSASHGVVVFIADTDDAAHDLMNGDPAVIAGVFRAELFPFSVALASKEILPPAS